jgi:ATP-binding cassette subfamily B protein/subfamily B ATP-binding cassette protein MsbA
MANFFRTLRLSLKYRWTIAAATFCALMVAVLWGGNIGALYPVVEVVFKGQSLDQWVDTEIKSSETKIADFNNELAALQRRAPADAEDAKKIARDLGYLQSRLDAEQKVCDRLVQAKPWVDQYLAFGPFQTLLLVIGALFVATLVKSAFAIAGQLLVERLAQLTTFELRKSFYRRTLRMDLASFGEKSTSDLIARFTNDMACISLGVQLFFGRAVREPLKTAACLIGAAFICWPLLVLSLLVAPLAALLIHFLARSMKRASRRAMEDMTVLFKVLSETLGGIKIVKAYTMERQERRRFHRVSKQYFHRAMKMALYDSFVRPTTEVMGILMIALAILAGAYLVLNQETRLFGVWMSNEPLSLGQLLVFYGFLAGVSDPSRKIGDVFGHLQRAYVSADRVYEVLDREPKILDSKRPAPLGRHRRDLTFEGVDFAYTPAHPVLHDIRLTIEFGETVAIVGPNGCGKSTLANLIPRFFDPTSGSVKVDGLDLRAVRRRELRRQIGLVTQETSLFDDTVLANIRYGTPWATREEAISAAMKAHAHRFITDNLQNGYETFVGPTGNRLSGGQRQRIALARAILRDPSILILDEATSQVDLESEQLIQKILAEFVRNRTTIIITHRLSVLSLADRIVVMDAGRILDVGTHEQLVGRCDLYARLCRIDFREAA